jgi:hypothetical protein
LSWPSIPEGEDNIDVSHHFDTPTAREDPRLNLCDVYLFPGTAATTVMAMTVNPAANADTVAPFRDEAIYAFRFDTNGDRREDVSFKVKFGEVIHVDAGNADPLHAQEFEIRRAEDDPAGLAGELVVSGWTDSPAAGAQSVRAFAGVVHDPFAGDAAALEAFKDACAHGIYHPQAFENRVNYFHQRRVAVAVLEVPNHLVSTSPSVNAWATVSLHGHAPEQQVARWGLPLCTHVFLGDDDLRERFNRSRPSDDDTAYVSSIIDTVARYVELGGTTADPAAYGRRVAALFGTLTLPYELGTPASFDFTGFNGRTLQDNVMDTMLTVLTNSPLGTGIRPDPSLFDATFPYFRPA